MKDILTDREKEVIECLLSEWSQGNMSLYGGLCYQDVFDLMKKLGVDSKEAETQLDNLIAKLDKLSRV